MPATHPWDDGGAPQQRLCHLHRSLVCPKVPNLKQNDRSYHQAAQKSLLHVWLLYKEGISNLHSPLSALKMLGGICWGEMSKEPALSAWSLKRGRESANGMDREFARRNEAICKMLERCVQSESSKWVVLRDRQEDKLWNIMQVFWYSGFDL